MSAVMSYRRCVSIPTIGWSSEYRRVAICTVLVLGLLHVNAAGLGSSSTINETHNSSSAPASAPAASGSACQSDNAARYDVYRIGQRNVGKGLDFYSLAEERSLGQAMADAIDAQTVSVTDPKVKGYIDGLGQKLVRNSDAQIPFTIKVIDSKSPTTFSLPGGFLYVDQALILDVDDEAELAGLMAHEIAHVVARHATRFATRRDALDVLSIPAARILGPAGFPARQLGLLSLERKLNREYEFAADLLGIEYQFATGYDPEAYIDALEKLDSEGIQKRAQAAKNDPNPDFIDRMYMHIGRSFSAYPPTETRILRLQRLIPKLLPCRDNYVLDTGEFQEVQAQLRAEKVVLHRLRLGEGTTGPVLQRHPSPRE
jgi:beta-barrel assembly-enhancing protease